MGRLLGWREMGRPEHRPDLAYGRRDVGASDAGIDLPPVVPERTRPLRVMDWTNPSGQGLNDDGTWIGGIVNSCGTEFRDGHATSS